jgi:hypothetical protein
MDKKEYDIRISSKKDSDNAMVTCYLLDRFDRPVLSETGNPIRATITRRRMLATPSWVEAEVYDAKYELKQKTNTKVGS